MNQELWTEKKAHMATEMQLLNVQQQFLNVLIQQAQAKDAALGTHWVDPSAPTSASELPTIE